MAGPERGHRLKRILERYLPGSVLDLLAGSSGRARISANTAWLAGDRVVRMLVGLAVGIWLARYLGPERYGIYSYAIAFVFLFTPARSLGLERVVVRELVKRPEDAGRIMASSLVPMAVGGVLALAASVTAIGLVRPSDPAVRWLVAGVAAGLVFQSLDVADYYNQSEMAVRYSVLPRGAAFLLASAAKVALILGGASVIAFGWVYGAEMALAGALLMAVYIARPRTPDLSRWKYDGTEARKLLSDSWPLMISTLLIVINMRIDQVMMGSMLGDRAVGIYSVAVRLTELWFFVAIILQTTLMPSVVRAGQAGRGVLDRRMHDYYRLMAGIAYIVIIPNLLLAGPLVGLLYGDAFLGAVPMLRWLIVSVLFINLGLARTTFLTSVNWTRLHLLSSVSGALINVALNLILIPRYGGMGAVAASLAAYWVQVHGSCFLIPALRGTGVSMARAMVFLPMEAGGSREDYP